SVASELLVRMGLAAPLGHFDLDDGELQSWMAGLHGGWVATSTERLGSPFLAADLDVRSAYPTVAVLLGWYASLRRGGRVPGRDGGLQTLSRLA
ncbi:MAG TPA: hypothetical protein VKA05_02980, partial [Acidimicrobiales bacterium]|nr:hypothetical protein [Acidimicrobiales bacterium]